MLVPLPESVTLHRAMQPFLRVDHFYQVVYKNSDFN